MPTAVPQSRNVSMMLRRIIDIIDELDASERQRVVETLYTYFGPRGAGLSSTARDEPTASEPAASTIVRFSEDRSMSAQQFIREKRPTTDGEKVACLLHYLKYYRDTALPSFPQISTLNSTLRALAVKRLKDAISAAIAKRWLERIGSDMFSITKAGDILVTELPERPRMRRATTPTRRSTVKSARR